MRVTDRLGLGQALELLSEGQLVGPGGDRRDPRAPAPGARRGRSRHSRRRDAVVVVAILAVVAMGAGGSVTAMLPPAAPDPNQCERPAVTAGHPTMQALPEHIFFVMLENASYRQIIAPPPAPAAFLNALGEACTIAADYYAPLHGSTQNYLLSVTGRPLTQVVDSRVPAVAHTRTLMQNVEASGRTWKAYLESMPTPCFTGQLKGDYWIRHNPFQYLASVRDDPSECRKVVPYSRLADDLRSVQTTPNYSYIVPNLCHDMHDACALRGFEGPVQEATTAVRNLLTQRRAPNSRIAVGDAWLQSELGQIFDSPAWRSGRSVLVITWDEDDFTPRNQVATIFVGPMIRAGYKSRIRYDSYSLLRTIEWLWRLPTLSGNDAEAKVMADVFLPMRNAPVDPTAGRPGPSASTDTESPVRDPRIHEGPGR